MKMKCVTNLGGCKFEGHGFPPEIIQLELATADRITCQYQADFLSGTHRHLSMGHQVCLEEIDQILPFIREMF